MTSRRSNRTKPVLAYCKLCMQDIHPVEKKLTVRGYIVCLPCALDVHKVLREHYVAPEITGMERVLHRKKHGNDGWREPSQQNDPGWVYYIRMGGAIKIGYATDVAKRMRAYPPTAELLAAHPGTKTVERDMHKRFADHLAHGREWFTESPELNDHIADVVTKFGDPSNMSYQYTKPKTQEERVADMFKTRQHVEVARGVHSAV